MDVKRFDVSYDYRGETITPDSLLLLAGNAPRRGATVSIAPHGESTGIYAADRVRVTQAIAIEGGLRYDRENWRPDDAAFSSRLNVVVTPNANTAIRASWGLYRQAERLDELSVEDGDASIHPAQISRDSEISVDHRFNAGVSARIAAYRRNIAHVRPRYENLFDRDEFFPEAKFDRIRIAPDASSASGVELLVKDDSARALSWWVSLVHSKVTDRIGGANVSRSFDQPDAASFSINYRRSAIWNFNVSGQIHTGWPTTSITAGFVPNTNRTFIEAKLGGYNQSRFRTYQRLDVRAMRSVQMSHGTFSSWLDVQNLLNHKNPCCGETLHFIGNQSTGIVQVLRNPSQIGWLPSFGIAWEF
jgi:hypothetical protein